MFKKRTYYFFSKVEIEIICMSLFFSHGLFFTIGVHLSKPTAPEAEGLIEKDVTQMVSATADVLPTEQELFDYKDALEADIQNLLGQALQQEVQKLELKAGIFRQMQLPEKPVSSASE